MRENRIHTYRRPPHPEPTNSSSTEKTSRLRVRYCPGSGHFPGNGAVVVKPDVFWGFDRSRDVFSVLDEFVGSGCGGRRYVCIRFSRIAVWRCNTISGEMTGTWTITDSSKARINLNGTNYDGVFLKEWDSAREKEVVTFSVLSGDGEAVWGVE